MVTRGGPPSKIRLAVPPTPEPKKPRTPPCRGFFLFRVKCCRGTTPDLRQPLYHYVSPSGVSTCKLSPVPSGAFWCEPIKNINGGDHDLQGDCPGGRWRHCLGSLYVGLRPLLFRHILDCWIARHVGRTSIAPLSGHELPGRGYCVGAPLPQKYLHVQPQNSWCAFSLVLASTFSPAHDLVGAFRLRKRSFERIIIESWAISGNCRGSLRILEPEPCRRHPDDGMDRLASLSISGRGGMTSGW